MNSAEEHTHTHAIPNTDHLLSPVTDKDLPKHIVNGFLRYSGFHKFAEGGTAILEECIDKNLGRPVLMKRLHSHLKGNDIEQKRFLREARVTALIQHPATVPMYEIGRDANGDPYFTMKKVEGENMRETIEGIVAGDPYYVKKYPLRKLVEVLVQIGQCVAFAHNRGVVHRDLKPANILVGGFGEAMLLDWGLAKVWSKYITQNDHDLQELQEQENYDLGLTRAGKRCGTPLYMSPEQAKGEVEHVDVRSDVYSMGAILYEILTHLTLVDGENREEVLKNIKECPFIPPRKRAPQNHIPPELDSICMKAVQKDPSKRYQSMKALVADLEAYLRREPVSCHNYSAWDRFVSWEQRHIMLSVAIGSAIVGAAAAAIFTQLLH